MLNKVIALGVGRGVKEIYFFDLDDVLYFDKQGNLMDPFATGDYVDPKTLPEFDHWEIVPFQAGKEQSFPFYSEESRRNVVAREEFARADMLDQITGWVKDGFESHDLVAKVREAGGLITLQDVGLEAPVDDTKKSKKQTG